jgi:hypothetical protein
MGKRIAIAAALVLALAGLGQLVFRYLFHDETPPAEPLVSAVVAPQAAPAAPMGERQITVISVSGKVERRGASSWLPVRRGEKLAQEEAIRTDEGAGAVLDIGGAATVEIAPKSQFAVREISESVAKVRIDEGRISAVVTGQKGKLRVETKGSDAVAEADAGEFDVLASGSGQMSVATKKGKVRLTSQDSTVEVDEGKSSVALPGVAPAAPVAIPPSLFLKLAGGKGGSQREKRTTVRGNTLPGAVISINGVRVHTDAKGGFTADVPLAVGKNKIVVDAEDVLGRKQSAEMPAITVTSEMAPTRSKAQWGRKSEDKVKW